MVYKKLLVIPDEPDNHHNNSDQKYEDGNPVHAVHQCKIDAARGIRVLLTEVEITKNLPPHNLLMMFQ